MAQDIGTIQFSQGGTSRYSEPFKIDIGENPKVVVAHGIGGGKLTAEIVRVCSTETGEEYSCNMPYVKTTVLEVISSMPYPCFELCAVKPIGFLVIPGWYRLKLSDAVPLDTVFVTVADVDWSATTSFNGDCTNCEGAS